MSVLFLAKCPKAGKGKGLLGADIHWGRRHDLATVMFGLFRCFKTPSNVPYALWNQTFHMPQQHARRSSRVVNRTGPINQPVATIWGLVV